MSKTRLKLDYFKILLITITELNNKLTHHLNETIKIAGNFAGIITSSKTKMWFTIPTKNLDSNISNISLTDVIQFEVRQNNTYPIAIGSSVENYIIKTNNKEQNSLNGLNISITKKDGTAFNAINNDVVILSLACNITFK